MTTHLSDTLLDHHQSAGIPEPRPVTTSSAADPVRRAAVIAGAALTLMAALAGFGNILAVEGLVTAGDAAATARDILASEGLFRLGVASLYLAALLDVVVAWALMRVFSPVNAELSRLGAWLRLAYAAVFMVALSQLVGIPALLSGSADTGLATTGQLQAQALAKVDAFHDIWFAGLILFGAHLVVTGYLAYRSGFVPRVIGVLLVVAGAGYVFDSLVTVFIEDAPFAVSSVTFLGELLLALWLLLRGRRIAVATRPAS
ncbi:MAG: DUF4386 domain-containing protein [Nocardioidaceae bacterium]